MTDLQQQATERQAYLALTKELFLAVLDLTPDLILQEIVVADEHVIVCVSDGVHDVVYHPYIPTLVTLLRLPVTTEILSAALVDDQVHFLIEHSDLPEQRPLPFVLPVWNPPQPAAFDHWAVFGA
jgi:hypothetical protein